MTQTLERIPEAIRIELRDVEREHLEKALQLGPMFRRGWLRIQEARGEISEISAERIIRKLGL